MIITVILLPLLQKERLPKNAGTLVTVVEINSNFFITLFPFENSRIEQEEYLLFDAVLMLEFFV